MTHNNKSGSRVNQKESTARIRARRQTSTGQKQLKKEAPKLKKAIKSRGTSSRTRRDIKDFAPSQTAADLSNLAESKAAESTAESTSSNLNVSSGPKEGQFVTGFGGVSPVEPNTPISDAATAFLATAAPAAVIAGGIGVAAAGIGLGIKAAAPTVGRFLGRNAPVWFQQVVKKSSEVGVIQKASKGKELTEATVKSNKLIKDEFTKQLRSTKTITTRVPTKDGKFKDKVTIIEEVLEQAGSGTANQGLTQGTTTNLARSASSTAQSATIQGSETLSGGIGQGIGGAFGKGGTAAVGVATLIGAIGIGTWFLQASLGNRNFQEFQKNEGSQSAGMALGFAEDAYAADPSAEGAENMLVALDLSDAVQDVDTSRIPFDKSGLAANSKAIKESNNIIRKAIIDMEFQRINGETDDERILRRKAEENAMFEAGQIREFERQKELIGLKEDSFSRGRSEEARYYERQLAKRAKFDEEERKKMADFWFEYNKVMQKLKDAQTPSRLGFGLL